MIPKFHQCEFCSKTFANEKNLSKHSCEYQKRYEYLTEKGSGVTLYRLYIFWLKDKKRSVRYVDHHTFIHSTHYKPFIRFIQFAKKYSLPDKKLYISYCNSKNISPKYWDDQELYERFICYYDEIHPYYKQLETSFKTIFQICEWLELDDPSQIFSELDSKTVLELLRRRKISPWLFFNSEVFLDYLKTKASASERDHVQQVTNPKRWRGIFESKPNERKKAIDIIKQMGL